MKKRIKCIMGLAETTLEELALAVHKKGFTYLMIHLDNENYIDEARVIHSDYYKINSGERIRVVFECGTGKKECRCKECITGCPHDTEPVRKEIAKNLRMLSNKKNK